MDDFQPVNLKRPNPHVLSTPKRQLGACQRPRGQARPAGLLQYRHRPCARRHHRTLRSLLTGRSHLCRNPGTSRRRNPAAMVRQGNRTNNARIARPLQPHLAVGLRSAELIQHPIRRSLVSQDQPNLLRRDRRRPSYSLGRRHFPTLAARPETPKNPARPHRAHGRGVMLRRIMHKVELRARFETD